jgi:hypothetical protein
VTADFPPTPEHPDEMPGLLEVYKSLVDGREAWYVSSPLTTGELMREVSSRQAAPGLDLESLMAREVVEPNRRRAEAYVRKLRDKTRYVINPAAVHDLSGWTQGDYRHFWGLVIQSFSQCVVFRDGWHLSSGCSWEFLVSIRTDIRTVDERLAPLSLAAGTSLIRNALADHSAANRDFLRGVLGSLEELGGADG